MPARSSARLIAMPPRSVALNPANAPESLPMGVRADPTITEPVMGDILAIWLVESRGPVRTSCWRSGFSVGTGGSVPLLAGRFMSMTTEIAAIREAILRGASGEEIGALPIPTTARGALVKADEQEMF